MATASLLFYVYKLKFDLSLWQVPLESQPSPQEVLVALVLNLEPGEAIVAAGLLGLVMGASGLAGTCLLGASLTFFYFQHAWERGEMRRWAQA